MVDVTFLENWLETEFIKELPDTFDVKVIKSDNGDFGAFVGVQFEAKNQGGYLYLWDSRTISYHLVDYILGKEVITDTLKINIDENLFSFELENITKTFRKKLNKC